MTVGYRALSASEVGRHKQGVGEVLPAELVNLAVLYRGSIEDPPQQAISQLFYLLSINKRPIDARVDAVSAYGSHMEIAA